MTPDPRDDLAWRRERNAAHRCAVLTQRAMAEAFSLRASALIYAGMVVAHPDAHTSEGGEG